MMWELLSSTLLPIYPLLNDKDTCLTRLSSWFGVKQSFTNVGHESQVCTLSPRGKIKSCWRVDWRTFLTKFPVKCRHHTMHINARINNTQMWHWIILHNISIRLFLIYQPGRKLLPPLGTTIYSTAELYGYTITRYTNVPSYTCTVDLYMYVYNNVPSTVHGQMDNDTSAVPWKPCGLL